MLCGSVERWIPTGGKTGFRKDLFGFIDIIAIDALSIVAIQSCGQSYAEHERRILDSDCTANVLEWLKAGGRVQVWGWRKVKLKRGGKAMRWSPRSREFVLGDFPISGVNV